MLLFPKKILTVGGQALDAAQHHMPSSAKKKLVSGINQLPIAWYPTSPSDKKATQQAVHAVVDPWMKKIFEDYTTRIIPMQFEMEVQRSFPEKLSSMILDGEPNEQTIHDELTAYFTNMQVNCL